MSDSHCLLKHLPESEAFTFHCSSYFTLNELNKKIMQLNNNVSKDDILNIIRTDLQEVRTKLNSMMMAEKNKKK